MSKFKIVHDRPNCIGCGACVAVSPEDWEMNADGKSDLIKAKALPDTTQEKELDNLGENMEAARMCPVNVIHIIDQKTNKKLI